MEAEKILVTCCSTILFTLLDMRRELTDRKVKGRCYFCHSLGLFTLVSEKVKNFCAIRMNRIGICTKQKIKSKKLR